MDRAHSRRVELATPLGTLALNVFFSFLFGLLGTRERRVRPGGIYLVAQSSGVRSSSVSSDSSEEKPNEGKKQRASRSSEIPKVFSDGSSSESESGLWHTWIRIRIRWLG